MPKLCLSWLFYEIKMAETDEEFVAACYDQILGREADAEGFSHYWLRLRHAEIDRDHLIFELLQSQECRSQFIFDNVTHISGGMATGTFDPLQTRSR